MSNLRQPLDGSALAKVVERIKPFGPAIVPLVELRGKRAPDLIGCSVALRLPDDRLFLLTANHVLEAFERREIVALTLAGGVILRGRVAASEVEASRLSTDKDDAAVFEFASQEGDAVGWLRANALSAEQLDRKDAVCQADELFALVGYPSNRVRQEGGKLVPSAHTWAGFSEAYSFERVGLSGERHVTIEWDNSFVHGFPVEDSDQRVISGQGRSIRGVSGSPMIVVANRDGPTTVSAIFTDHRDGHLIGTSVKVHLEYIAELLPKGE